MNTEEFNVQPARVSVLGVSVTALTIPRAIAFLIERLNRGVGGYVCVTGAHGIILSQRDIRLREIHDSALLVTPDGMPVVWMLRQLGQRDVDRVYGPDLMHAVFAAPQLVRRAHFFFGSTAETVDLLVERTRALYPDLIVAGRLCPAFGAWTERDKEAYINQIRAARPEIIWIGLSTPKQERWMAEAAPHLSGTIMIGVGAGFDFLAGVKSQAPLWVRRRGLEWLYRLITEPRRLWRRYAVIVPSFATLALLQLWRERHKSTP